MRLDIESLSPPKKQGDKFTFTDKSQPGQTLQIELRPLDWLEEQAAMEQADSLAIRYITGGWVDERGLYQKDPCPIEPIGGVPVVLTYRALKEASMIAAMQVSDEPYDAIWLCRFALAMPNAWAELQVAARTLSAEYAKAEKKTDLPEGTAISLESA